MIRSVTKAFTKPSFLFKSQLQNRTLVPELHSRFSILSNKENPSNKTDYLNKISLTSSFSRHFAAKRKFNELDEPVSRPRSTIADSETKRKKYWFRRVSDEVSLHNSQSLFMKCRELLSEKAITEFVRKIDRLKEKFISDENTSKEDIEEGFLISCEKFFERNNAKELMYYLERTQIHDLRPKMLNSTVFDLESQVDIKSKVDKFNLFSVSNSPMSSYVSGEEQAKLEALKSDEQINEMLINKVTKLNMTTNALKKSLDPSEFKRNKNAKANSESEEEADEMMIKAFGEEGMQDVNFFGEIKGLEGMEEIPANKFIMNDLEEISEDDNISEFASTRPRTQEEFDVSRAIDTTAASMIKKTRKDYLKDRFQAEGENIMLYKTQGKDEVIYLKQRGFDKKVVKPTNWIYLYGLPYKINDPEGMKEDIQQHFEESIGNIKNIELFSYKDFLDISKGPVKVNVTENLDNVFDPISAQKQGMEGFDLYDHSSYGQDPESKPEKPKRGSIQAKLKATENVLKNLQAKTDRRLDRSYALIELPDAEAKKRALSSDIRIFGIHINGKMCMVDDADYKFTLNCYNVHWCSSLKNFCTFINKVFEEKNLMDLMVEIPPEFEKKLMTKFYVLLRFNSLYDTTRAMKALEGSVYEKRCLKFHHLYGSLKCIKGKYTEAIDLDTTAQKYEKVNEGKLGMIHKISMITKHEEASNEVMDPLGRIGKDLQTYEINGRPAVHEDYEETYQVRKQQDNSEESWYQSTESVDEEEDRYESEIQHKGLLFSKS